MENLLTIYYNNIIENIQDIFTDPIIFIPGFDKDIKSNKNAIIKYLIYVIMIITLLTQSWNLIIFLLVCLILIQIIGSKMINIKKNTDIIYQNKYNQCRKSTINNPMGNALLYTSTNELNNENCKFQDKLMDKNLRYNIYNNSNDLFLKKNNIRPFITMPSQIYPNNIDNFKKNLYYFDNPTCKLNNINCMYNEDLRYHKTDFTDR
jgi:hypothetical protein